MMLQHGAKIVFDVSITVQFFNRSPYYCAGYQSSNGALIGVFKRKRSVCGSVAHARPIVHIKFL